MIPASSVTLNTSPILTAGKFILTVQTLPFDSRLITKCLYNIYIWIFSKYLKFNIKKKKNNLLIFPLKPSLLSCSCQKSWGVILHSFFPNLTSNPSANPKISRFKIFQASNPCSLVLPIWFKPLLSLSWLVAILLLRTFQWPPMTLMASKASLLASYYLSHFITLLFFPSLPYSAILTLLMFLNLRDFALAVLSTWMNMFSTWFTPWTPSGLLANVPSVIRPHPISKWTSLTHLRSPYISLFCLIFVLST